RPHLPGPDRAGRPSVDVVQRAQQADQPRGARLRTNPRGCDVGVREVLARDYLMAPGDDFVRFSEYEDVLASLEVVALVAPLVRDKPQYWKWVIVGAHDALQGAMVCAYADSTGTSVLAEKSAKEMLDWLNADQTTQPRQYLAPFDELLNRCVAGRKP